MLVRPSFVLSGAAMSVASSLVQLNSCLQVRVPLILTYGMEYHVYACD